MSFFFLGEGLHQLGHDLILAGELGFEQLDLLVLGVLNGLALAAVVEGGMTVLEELLEPGVELVGVEVELIAEIGDGDPPGCEVSEQASARPDALAPNGLATPQCRGRVPCASTG